MRVPIVNEHDEIIGHKERDELTPQDIVRASGVWIVNSRGEALVAQRAANKKFNPLKWAVSAAGMVEEEESYASNVVREVYEELGITITEDELVPGMLRCIPRNSNGNSIPYFYQAYFLRRDVPIEDMQLQKEEVEAVRWVSIPALREWYAQSPNDFFPRFHLAIANLEGFVAANL